MLKEKYGYLLKKQAILIIIFISLLVTCSIIATILFLNERNNKQLTQVNTITKKKENNKNNLPNPPSLTLSKVRPPAKGKIYYSEKHESNSVTNKLLNVSTGYEEGLNVRRASVEKHNLISNDGTKLAYYDSDFGLAIKDLKNNTDILLLENKKVFNKPTESERFRPFQWSPDSKKLLVEVGYWESSTIGVLDVNSKNFRYITNVDGSSSGCISGKWMSDSQRIILSGYNYGHPCNIMPGLYVVNITNMQTQPLFGTELDKVTFTVDESFERAGNKLLFKATKDFTKASDEDGVYEIDLSSKAISKLNISQVGKIRFDDNSYFYSTGDKIILYNLNTKNSKLVVENQDKALTLIPVTLSPDNKYLAYVLRVVKYNASGNAIYSNITEDNILKAIDLESGKIYDLVENVDIYSPIVWLPE